MIINLPKNLEKETTHRYGPNSFKLHRYYLCWVHSHVFCILVFVQCVLGCRVADGNGHVCVCVVSLVYVCFQHHAFACVSVCASHITHHTSPVCRLPMPRPGQVLGLVGTNGIGKSTALKILAGKLKPNLGRFAEVGVVP